MFVDARELAKILISKGKGEDGFIGIMGLLRDLPQVRIRWDT